VSGPDYLAAAAALFNSFTFERLIPLLTLLGMASMFMWVLFKAQRADGFDASEFLRDDRGKLSWGRIAAAVCLMTHTWVVFVRTLGNKITIEELVLYAVTWSGSLVLLQALEVWRGIKTPTANMPPEQTP
jgi:hypothetical protein